MKLLEIGSKVKHLSEGCYFDTGDAGCSLIISMSKPTKEEIESVSAGSKFEIRETIINSAMWITVKFGSMAWMDASYTPHLSKSGSIGPVPDDPDTGYILTVYLIDNSTDTVVHMRSIGLGHDFSRILYEDIQKMLDTPFSEQWYNASLSSTMCAFDTKDIVKRSGNAWRLRSE